MWNLPLPWGEEWRIMPAPALLTLGVVVAAAQPGPSSPPPALPPGAPLPSPVIEHITRDPPKAETPDPIGYSYSSISDDGRFVAYTSGLDKDLNRHPFPGYYGTGAFLFDRATGERQMIGARQAALEPGARFEDATISGDGRFVAFVSDSNHLAPTANNNTTDVFVWNRLTGDIEHVSVSSRGTAGNGPSGRYNVELAVSLRRRDDPEPRGPTRGEHVQVSISRDGRYVAFTSAADNLVPGDNNGHADVFVRDRLRGQTTRVSVSSGGREGRNGHSSQPAISPDGRYVAFVSSAARLFKSPTNGFRQLYIHDRETGRTGCLSLRPNGKFATGNSEYPRFSGDGRYVVFLSEAPDLVEGDTNGLADIFIKDLHTGRIVRVEVADPRERDKTSKGPIVWYYQFPSLSHDGRLLAFSTLLRLHPDDTNDHRDLYLLDLRTGKYQLLSRSLNDPGAAALAPSARINAQITPDGGSIVFESLAPDFIKPNDEDDEPDIFVVDLVRREWEGLPPAGLAGGAAPAP